MFDIYMCISQSLLVIGDLLSNYAWELKTNFNFCWIHHAQ